MKALTQILVLVVALASLPTFAGSNQATEIKHSVEEVETFAKQVERYAAKNRARAFIIGRVGRPEKDLPKGIRFTHTAIAVYSEITLDTGEVVKGYAIHNLYQKEGKLNKSKLVVDYPVDFFWGVDALKAGVIIPNEELQTRLIEVIASGKDKLIHNENYSVIANPFNNRYQNCTEHTLNVINAGIYQTTDMTELKSNAKAHFKAQRVKTNPFKLLLGSVFMDDVKTKDHKGKIRTATFTTIGKYLELNQLVKKAIVLEPEGKETELW